jgi:hypothetical protein
MKTKTELEYCDEKLLAQSFAVSISTVRRWRRIGGGPKFIHFGKSVRYKLADVEKWVAAQFPAIVAPRSMPTPVPEKGDSIGGRRT